jgi:predicted RNA methylase
MYRILAAFLIALLTLAALPALFADDKKKDEEKVQTDVVYWPTPQEVVEEMLKMAKVTKEDIVYDLGCGDARIPVTAAKKYGCKAWGFDIDPARIKDSEENVKKNDIGKLVTIKKQNIFADDFDISKASVVTLYLLPELNVRLIPKLEKLKDGSRIVSHDFDMRGCKPKETKKMNAKRHDGVEGEHTIYLWITPLEKEKEKDK